MTTTAKEPVGTQSRDFIDGYGIGVEHGLQMAREDAKYWEGWERGLAVGQENAARDAAVLDAYENEPDPIGRDE